MKKILVYISIFIFNLTFSQNIQLFQEFNGKFDFVAIGNTMNLAENNSVPTPPCIAATQSSAVLNLAPNQTIHAAYLYWARSGGINSLPSNNVTLNGTNISPTINFQNSLNLFGNLVDFYGGFADITSLIQTTGNGTYTLSNFDINPILSIPNNPYCQISLNFAGWSIVVVYEELSLTINRQVNVYHGFQPVSSANNQIDFTLSGLNITTALNSKVGFLTWEGDTNAANNESLRINNNIKSALPLNPGNNPFNGTNTYTGASNLYNMDLDVFSIASDINVGDTSINIRLTSSQDLVIVNNVVTSVATDKPDATIVMNNTSINCATNELTINYTVSNTLGTIELQPNTPISFYINNVLIGTTSTTIAIPVGGSQTNSISFILPNNTPLSSVLLARVDDTGTGTGIVNEYFENNNTNTLNLNYAITPIFTQVAPICEGGNLNALPTTSNNGITGTWSQPLNNTQTTTYTFTPNPGQCATNQSMTIVVYLPTVITSQVTPNQSVCINSPASISVSATGESLTYQWYSNTINSTTGGTLIVGETNNTYSPPTNIVATMYYYVVVSGTCGIPTPNISTLNVTNTTVITNQPISSQTVCQNDTPTNLSVIANGTNPITYQWFSNNSNNNTGGSLIAGATSNIFTPPTNTAGTTYYYAIVSAGCGNRTSLTSEVNVNPSTIITLQPISSQTLCINSTINNLVVNATGTSLSYQWYSNITNNNFGGTIIPGAINTLYSPPNNITGTFYYYTVVSGTCGVVPSNVSVVNVTPNTTITQPISTQTICQNNSPTNLSVTATGTNPITYQWYSNNTNNNSGGTLIAGATNNNFTPPTNVAGTTYYYVTVTGGCNSQTSLTSEVIVNPSTIITLQPISSQTICIQSAPNNLIVNSTGASLSYQWFSNTTNSNIGGTLISGEINSFYSPTSNIAGTFYYYAVVSGSCGIVPSNVSVVNVTPNTTITQPISTQTICQNNPPTNLSVTATGTNPISYQWYSNNSNNNTGGTLIAGATNNNFTPPTNIAGTTYYYVIVTGSCSSQTSSTSQVIVNPSTIITLQPISSQTICIQSAPNNLIVNATGASLSYQWFSNTTNSNIGGTLISGAINSFYSPNSNVDGTFYYYAVVSGTCGVVPSNVSTVVITPRVVPTFNTIGPICFGNNTFSLPNTSLNGITGTWSPSSINSNSTSTYTFSPTFGSCATSQTMTIVVNPIPPAPITTPPSAPYCKGQTSIPLQATGTNLLWYNSLTGGTGSTTAITPSTTTAGIFNYYVTQTINGCESPRALIQVTVLPTPSFTSNTPYTICTGDSTNIQLIGNHPDIKYSWNSIGEGLNGVTSGFLQTNFTNSILTLQAGITTPVTRIYTITPSIGDCAGPSQTITITVNPIPNVTAIPEKNPICSGEFSIIKPKSDFQNTIFEWFVDLTQTSGVTGFTGNGICNINHQLTTTGTSAGYVRYVITPRIGNCFGTPTAVIINVNPLPTAIPNFSTIIKCSGQTPGIVVSSANSQTTYVYEVFATSNVSGASSGTINTNVAFINNQTLINTNNTQGYVDYVFTPILNGCKGANISIRVFVNPIPNPTLKDGIICIDTNGNVYQNYILNAGLDNLNYTFQWTFTPTGSSAPIPLQGNQNIQVANAIGTYSVIAKNINTNCTSGSVTARVTSSLPATSIMATVSEMFSDYATISVKVIGGTGDYLYQLSEGNFQSSPIFNNVSPGTYIVKVIDTQGCTYLTTSVLVINYMQFFTPNGDGFQDVWKIIGLNQEDTKIYIFDRYGKLLKQLSGSENTSGWDGTFNGQPLPASDYWFTIDYKENNQIKTFKSHFSLKR